MVIFPCLLGLPTLVYGIGASALVRHFEDVVTPSGTVRICFWYEEDKDATY